MSAAEHSRLRRILSGFVAVFALAFLAAAPGLGQAPDSIRIAGSDGHTLGARRYAGESGRPGVLLLHQCDRSGAATGYESLARRLAGRGMHVLELDFRGHGGSRSERFDGTNWREAQAFLDEDAGRALDYLVERPGVDASRLTIVGASCGGRVALRLAADRPEVRAIGLLSVGLPQEPTALLEPVSERPLFCVAAENDPYGRTFEAMREAFERSRHPQSRLVLYKGRHHGTPLFEEDPDLEAQLAAWIEARLAAVPRTGRR